MHELAVCQALLGQVDTIVRERGALAVTRVVVRIGPLSGVEPSLLASAFTLARAGTAAATAVLALETGAVRVHCRTCGAESGAAPNRLVCGACGDWQTRLVAGDELLLVRVELDLPDPAPRTAPRPTDPEPEHV